MYNIESALNTYRRVIKVCQTPGFFLELDRKRYFKKDLTYDFVIDNAPRIGYIETTDIENSRIYLSTFIMFLLAFSMDRKHPAEKGIEFVGMSESLVTLMYRISLWNINSGYNSAINDVKTLIGKLNNESEHLNANM